MAATAGKSQFVPRPTCQSWRTPPSEPLTLSGCARGVTDEYGSMLTSILEPSTRLRAISSSVNSTWSIPWRAWLNFLAQRLNFPVAGLDRLFTRHLSPGIKAHVSPFTMTMRSRTD
ncbi:hypothetical protein P168DRAFT_306232 [Aspergillus campestris IBT 28561]|uniref:Uncharacterized protein n=1 Tax=Aspergillus campestris (strain IBT 28561) TaxID=1392248 RepID=A0A2I1CWK5_ASPC2|nr:uncharacterized protein P168DRAFT_306232 [Aspergillus campestris IBT 28561]PKY02002.1 hypothetical protein P168DRAFT_306232 [Aspergillus campestris IBT 28561]